VTRGDGKRQTTNGKQFSTVAECLQRACELEATSDSARLDVEILLAKILKKPRAFLYAWAENKLTPEQQTQFNQWLTRRMQGEPIAYIVGEKEFWSLNLQVNSSTLIPRPETELLVEAVLELLPTSAQKILDLGTGTGAVALALATERPKWQLLAVDNSPAAVNLAIDNCRNLELTNVAINRSNWFDNVRETNFDAIVCNPPYIAPSDPHLSQGDVCFEPRTALVAEHDGLADLQIVIGSAGRFLNDAGWLLVEHGWQQSEQVRDLFINSNFQHIESKKDLAGIERITLGQNLPGPYLLGEYP